MLMAGNLGLLAEVVVVDDSQTTMSVAAVRSISWTGDFKTGNLVFHFVDGQQTTVPFTQIARIVFRTDDHENPSNPENPDTPDGMQQTAYDSMRVSVSGDHLLLSGLPAQCDVRVFSASGCLVSRLVGSACMSLRALPAGTYIVQAGDRSVKILKR